MLNNCIKNSSILIGTINDNNADISIRVRQRNVIHSRTNSIVSVRWKSLVLVTLLVVIAALTILFGISTNIIVQGFTLVSYGTNNNVNRCHASYQQQQNYPSFVRNNKFLTVMTTNNQQTKTNRKTQLHMSSVFDFLKERSKEGLDQLDKFSTAALKGEFNTAFADVATYTKETNTILTNSLLKSRNKLLQNLESLVTGQSLQNVIDNLYDVLIQSDIGSSTSDDIIAEVQSLLSDSTTTIISQRDIKSIIRGKLIEALDLTTTSSSTTTTIESSSSSSSSTVKTSDIRLASKEFNMPTIYMIIGANGMGKTTTIGKLAYKLQNEYNLSVLMVAADTYRAGAVDQLQLWSTRVGCDIIIPDTDTDSGTGSTGGGGGGARTPAAVLYKALDYAFQEKTYTIPVPVSDNNNDNDAATTTTTITKPYSYDVIIVDTSGRLSNNDALTKELVKMKNVIIKRYTIQQQKLLSLAAAKTKQSSTTDIQEQEQEQQLTLDTIVPHETLLVIDAAQGGSMALSSAKVWDNEIGLSGLVITKLDGTARGGSVISIARELSIPVKFIGVGEQVTDLQLFNRERFVDGLLGIGSGVGGASASTTTKKTNAGTPAFMKGLVSNTNNDNNNRNTNIDNEAKQLTLRLQELRKERDERAKATKAAAAAAATTNGKKTPQQKTTSSVVDSVPSTTAAVSTTMNTNTNFNSDSVTVLTGGGGGGGCGTRSGSGMQTPSNSNRNKKKSGSKKRKK